MIRTPALIFDGYFVTFFSSHNLGHYGDYPHICKITHTVEDIHETYAYNISIYNCKHVTFYILCDNILFIPPPPFWGWGLDGEGLI